MKNVYRLVCIFVGLFLAAGMIDAQGGTYDAWGYRMKIRFAGYDRIETLTNFPTLVVLSTNIPGFSYSAFNSPVDGADLRFAASNETTELNYEIEQWNTNGSSYVWVQKPFLANSTDFIYAYWGNATNAAPCTTNGSTWTSSDLAVYHLGETNGAPLIRDSTAHGKHATSSGTVKVPSSIVGGAQGFNGTSSYIAGPTNMTGYGVSGSFTLMTWFRTHASGLQFLFTDGSSYNNSYGYLFVDSPGKVGFLVWGGAVYTYNDAVSTTYASEEWHLLVKRYDGATVQLFLDGVLKNQAALSGPVAAGTQNLRMGQRGNNNYLNGEMDEIRISSLALSTNWIYACWLNQAANGSFLTYSGAGPLFTRLAVQADAVTGIGPSYATLNGTVGHAGGAEKPDVYICWDTADKGTNNLSDWAHPLYLGANWGINESFSTNITGLQTGSSYSYRCYVTNSTGTDWSDTVQTFTTFSAPVAAVLSATHVARVSALLRGQISDTGGQIPSAWIYVWADGGATTNIVAMGTQSGIFSSNVTGLAANTLYHYQILASNAVGVALSGVADFQTRTNTAGAWYVASSGDNTTATNWDTAISSVQEALNNAATNDTIYLKGELFGLAQQLTWAKSYVSVVGGYQGIGSPGNRDSLVWPTTITRSVGSNHRIFYISGVTNGVMTGVTVTNGYAISAGGAAHPLASGGGMYLSSCVNFMLDDCRVLFNQGYDPTPNGADIYGGGIFMEASSVTLTNCIISSNRVDAINTDNLQSGNGGGVALFSGTCWINNCFIEGNSAKGGYAWGVNRGGGLFLNGTATLRNTVIKYNDSVSSGNYTGRGDGVWIGSGGNVQFDNCLITDNHGSDSGMAFWQAGGTLRLNKCTIATNKTFGIYSVAGGAGVTNSILWRNGDEVFETVPGSVALSYSDIGDGTSNGVNGCVSVDPLFVDTTYFHLKSKLGNYVGGYFSGGSWSNSVENSPLLEQGDPASDYSLEPPPNGKRINMGAYANTSVASLTSALMGTVFTIR